MQMRKVYNFVSKDPSKLLEILALRRQGFSLEFLAELYNCDRTSLRYQCRKYQIFPNKTVFIKNSNEIFDPRRIASQITIEINPPAVSHWTMIDGEKVNLGKSYKDYLASKK